MKLFPFHRNHGIRNLVLGSLCFETIEIELDLGKLSSAAVARFRFALQASFRGTVSFDNRRNIRIPSNLSDRPFRFISRVYDLEIEFHFGRMVGRSIEKTFVVTIDVINPRGEFIENLKVQTFICSWKSIFS